MRNSHLSIQNMLIFNDFSFIWTGRQSSIRNTFCFSAHILRVFVFRFSFEQEDGFPVIPYISTNKWYGLLRSHLSGFKSQQANHVVRITGVEPARGCPPDPKSGASANSAISANIQKRTRRQICGFGADDEARTRYLHLGKVALYQMSYIRDCNGYYSRPCSGCQVFFYWLLSGDPI